MLSVTTSSTPWLANKDALSKCACASCLLRSSNTSGRKAFHNAMRSLPWPLLVTRAQNNILICTTHLSYYNIFQRLYNVHHNVQILPLYCTFEMYIDILTMYIAIFTMYISKKKTRNFKMYIRMQAKCTSKCTLLVLSDAHR